MQTQYLDQAGGKIAFEVMGSGPLVICVPSMGDLRAEYRFLAPLLSAAGFSVAMMDVRGHGESDIRWPDYSVGPIGEDIVALIRRLGNGPAAVLGTSMAAGAAVYAAAEAPELIARLVLISPFVRDLGSGGLLPKLFQILFADAWGPALWRKYYASLYPSRQPDDFDAYLSQLQANLREPGRMAALRKMIAASKAASGERLAHIKQPALVIMGSRDPDFKSFPDEPRRVADQLHGTYQPIAGAGHYPHAEMPDIAAPIIVPFLQSLSMAMPHGA